MKQFALLSHDHPFPHWDFLLETGEHLTTWRLLSLPNSQGVAQTISAERLPDHRKMYLDYEGPVSGNRGQVQRVDRGAYILIEQTETYWQLRIEGEMLQGFATLAVEGSGERDSNAVWSLLWVPG